MDNGLVPKVPDRLIHGARILAAASGIACVLAFALVLPLWVFVVIPRERAERDERIARVAEAVLRDPRANAADPIEEADGLIEADRKDPLALLLHATAHRADRQIAAADMAALAGIQPSDYLGALSRVATQHGFPPGEAVRMPEPATDLDRATAAYLALVRGEFDRADSFVDGSAVSEPILWLGLESALRREPFAAERASDFAKRLEILRGRASSRTRFAQARAMLAQGRWAEAAAFCEDSLSLRPDDPAVLLALAECEVGLGDRASAIRILKRAVASSPTHAPCRARLAELVKSAGHR
ncbi:MAG: hypothetical protein Fur0037_06170 [Planctomycetota bacterium]